nr:hypothetical protein [Tanacetum cinerariifolium]
MTSVPALPLVSEPLFHVRTYLIPPPKRLKDIGYLADVDDDPRETRDERVTHPAMPEDIPEPAQEGVAEVTYETLGDLVQRFHDHTQDIPAPSGGVTELRIKAASLESRKDSLTDQVKILSDRVAELDSELMRMDIGLAIDKGMQTGLVAGIDHEKAGRDFNFLSQFESQKDASIACIMDSLCLKGLSVKTLEVSWLQPAYEQLLLPIYRKDDNAVIGETSLFNSLNVVHDRVQKVKKGALSHHLSICELMGPLVDPLSSENLVGKASTLRVPATTATIATLSISNTTAIVSSIPPISVTDY